MRITQIEIIPVRVPSRPDTIHSAALRDPLHMGAVAGRRPWSLQFDELPKYLYRVHTDDGLVGLGESYRAVNETAVRGIAASLEGAEPLKLNLRDLPIPYSREYDGFEVALFDLVGKRLGLPLYQLLGGAYRSRVSCSAWSGRRTTEEAVAKAREARERGFDCIKFKADLSDDVAAWCEGIRDACGPAFRVVLDPNQRWQRPAEVMRFAGRLEAAGNVLTLEDPVPRWNLDWYRLLREKTRLPITLHIHLPYVDQGQRIDEAIRAVRLEAVDYFNFGGGLANFQRLAAIADAAGIPYWHGSEVDLGILEASYLHVAAATRHCTLPSDIFGEAIREDDLIRDPLTYDGQGHFVVPQGPGLGVELDEEAVERYRIS